MGFNRYQHGPSLPCEVTDGFIRYQLMSGKWLEYPTNLKVNIPLQTIQFKSPTVAFCLDFDNRTYIGRFDGSISIYSPCGGNRLVGLNNWEQPLRPEFPTVGYVNHKVYMEDIFLDPADMQTLYHGNTRDFYVLPAPVKKRELVFNTTQCLALVNSDLYAKRSLVLLDGKEVVSNVPWVVPTLPRGAYMREFL